MVIFIFRDWCVEKNVNLENGELIAVSRVTVSMKGTATILLENVNVYPDIMAKK